MSQTKGFWLSILLVFGAQRLADMLNAYTGLWVIPTHLPGDTLGALLPLMSVGTFLALPVGVFATVFTRQLCTYATVGDGPKVRGLLRDALAATFLTFLAAILVIAVALPWLCRMLRVETPLAAYLAVVCGLLSAIVPIFSAALQALRRFGAIAVTGLLSAPTRLIALLLALPALGLAGYFLGQIAMLAVMVAVACWALRGLLFGQGDRAAWRDDARPMLRYAAKVAVVALVGFIPAFISSFLIRTRLPDVESGAYYLLTRFSEIATYCGSAITLVLFPFAVTARTQGRSSARLHDGALLATLGGGVLLAAAFWFLLPWLFAHIPGYAAYVPHARLAAYLTLITTLNLASAAHFVHAQAREDFRFLRYYIPVSIVQSAMLWCFATGSLLRVLHLLFVCALLQLLCVGAERFFTHERIPS